MAENLMLNIFFHIFIHGRPQPNNNHVKFNGEPTGQQMGCFC